MAGLGQNDGILRAGAGCNALKIEAVHEDDEDVVGVRLDFIDTGVL